MNLNTRSKKTVANAFSNIINKIVISICGFIVRTILIKTLGQEYLGINGLFSSILSMLSLADLGIGIALPFSLYKPLADNNKRKITQLMSLYSKIYTIIGIVVLVIGLFLLPFIDKIIKGETNIDNLYLIYVLFVINSAVSYLEVHKRTLIEADQKGYIVNRIANIIKLVLMIFQIIELIAFKNYIIYFSTNIVFVIVENLVIAKKCNKIYPFIKNKQIDKLDKVELKEIGKNSYSLIFYKICNVVLGSTDNILISYFCGINMVGLYSNYLLIIETVQGMVSQLFNAITASIGNLVSTEENKKSYRVFNNLNFVCYCIFGICTVGLINLTNDFINIWIGHEYVLSTLTLVVIVINFYLLGCQSVISAYRTAYGLFWHGRYRPVAAVIINIVASIILAKYIGLDGILIGTTISRLSTLVWYDAYIVHKYGLKESVKSYYKKYIMFSSLITIITVLEIPIIQLVEVNNFITFMLKAIFTIALTSIILLAVFYKNNNLKDILNYIKDIINQKKEKNLNAEQE